MPEYASNAKGNTAVTLGAIGTAGTILGALGAMNNNCCGNSGLFGNFFGNNCNNNCNEFVRNETFGLGLVNASQKAELYADRAVADAGRETIAEFRRSDQKIADVVKDTTAALIETGKAVAVLDSQVKCLQKEMELQNQITNQKFEYENKLTNQKIENLRVETEGAIALEAERRANGDNNLYCYVNATFVPGKLVMPKDAICPEVMPRYNCWQAPTCTTTETGVGKSAVVTK